VFSIRRTYSWMCDDVFLNMVLTKNFCQVTLVRATLSRPWVVDKGCIGRAE